MRIVSNSANNGEQSRIVANGSKWGTQNLGVNLAATGNGFFPLKKHRCLSVQKVFQSIPAVPIPPPPGNRGAFAHVVSPGGGTFTILSWPRGLGISVPRGNLRSFDTSVKATTSREKNVRGQINMVSVLRIYLLLANHSRARRHNI